MALYMPEYHERWLDANGARVRHDGHTWILRVTTHKAVYPYDHTAFYLNLEPTADTKRSAYYRDEKHKLGDDWSIAMEESPELMAEVWQQVAAAQTNPGDEDVEPEEEERPAPADDDYVISDARRGGYYVTQLNHTFLEWDVMLRAIAQNMNDRKFWPNVWYVNDHGNLDLLRLKVKEIRGKVIKVSDEIAQSWV